MPRTGNFRIATDISRKKDNLERLTEFSKRISGNFVPFGFKLEFPEILVEWNARCFSNYGVNQTFLPKGEKVMLALLPP